MNSNLAFILAQQAQRRPDAIALHDVCRGRERSVTFAELGRLSAQAAALLHANGSRTGDAILVFQPMSVELYVALLAIFRLGATAMFLDPSAGLSHLEQCCALVPPRGFLAPIRAHLLRLVSPALRRIPVKFLTSAYPLPYTKRWASLANLPPRDEITPVDADTPALLTFTSGSTGQPKAAVRTHGFLRAQHLALEKCLTLQPGEVDLATLPIFVLANLASGVTSVLADAHPRQPAGVQPVAAQIARHRPTRSAASPAFFERLLDTGDTRLFADFRKIHTGGAPVFPGLLARLRAAAGPGADIFAVYGSTEAEPIAELPEREITAEDHLAMSTGRGLLAGKPVPSIQLRVIADRWGTPLGHLAPGQFDALASPPGAPGEIVVQGAHVLQGYLHGHGDEETKFRVGPDAIWHRTGDAGTLDDTGRLWLLGRCAARVSDHLGTLYPFSVECAAMAAKPFVRRCAFVSLESRRLLVVEPQPPSPQHPFAINSDFAGLQSRLSWAGLSEIRVMQPIPVDRRHQAKIDYPALRKMLRNERKPRAICIT